MTGVERTPRRILVVKLADLGDAVLALPAIQAIRSTFPDARIDVLTTHTGGQIFRLSPAISRVIEIDKARFDRATGFLYPRGWLELTRLFVRLRRARYDTVLLFHHLTTAFGTLKFRGLTSATGAARVVGLDNGRGSFLDDAVTDFGFGALPEWEYNLEVARHVASRAIVQRPCIDVPEEAVARIDCLLAESGVTGPYLVVHPSVGAYAQSRAWPADYLATAARWIRNETGLAVVIVGASLPSVPPVTMKIDGAIDLTDRTTVPELCEVIRRAELVIGSDSAIVHIAGAYDRPHVAIFGPSNAAAWKPFGATEVIAGASPAKDLRSVAIRSDLPCSPCFYSGFSLGRPEGCRLRSCLHQIRPAHVRDIALSVMRAHEGPPGT